MLSPDICWRGVFIGGQTLYVVMIGVMGFTYRFGNMDYKWMFFLFLRFFSRSFTRFYKMSHALLRGLLRTTYQGLFSLCTMVFVKYTFPLCIFVPHLHQYVFGE